MKFSIGTAESLSRPHKWFAWYPVVARQRGTSGFVYYLVWMRSVTRSTVSAMGITQRTYEI